MGWVLLMPNIVLMLWMYRQNTTSKQPDVMPTGYEGGWQHRVESGGWPAATTVSHIGTKHSDDPCGCR